MKTRRFYTTGNCDINEEVWDKPEPKHNEIEVQAVFTGVCRSDIDMYSGSFKLLPKEMQGHEGVGIVTKVGSSTEFKVGDYVATRGEPAFSDFYNCDLNSAVTIPDLSPKYIIEPVACGINVANALGEVECGEPILLLGTGFLAMVVHSWLGGTVCTNVVGSANSTYWGNQKNITRLTVDELVGKKYAHVIDLSDKPEYLSMDLYAPGAHIVMGAEKHPTYIGTFSEFLWNNVTLRFPSPRDANFKRCMTDAVEHIKNNRVDTSLLWTRGYFRDTEVEEAFNDGYIRVSGSNYSRGYIKWAS